jgi:hypothetical protein
MCAALVAPGYPASAAGQNGFPFTSESLTYTINWPSGLSLGEAHLDARKGPDGWEFELSMEAGVPGFSVRDRYRSSATGSLCSLELEKESVHGPRKAREKTVFEPDKRMAVRTTLDGGSTEIPVADCARDALGFLFYARRELGQGRVAPPQTVLFGSPYDVRLDYTGPQTVSVNNVTTPSDRVTVALKGPSSDLQFEIFFARDAARTPLVIRAPFAMGTFSMELTR